MIVCISVNPALDRSIVFESFELGRVNRATSAEVTPGGKASNVALGARALGAAVTYIGLLGGSTGAELEQGLALHGVKVEAVKTLAPTRINLELIDGRGVTEVLEPGGTPSSDELEQLRRRCHGVFRSCAPGSVAVFSGSLPPGVEAGLYAELIGLARTSGLRAVLDSSGTWLERGLSGKPDFVKPNQEEAEALVRRPVRSPIDARIAVRELLARGAGAAIVSLGADGLVGSLERGAALVAPPRVEATSAVACGDVTLAGLAVALERRYGRIEQLAFAAACGAANCLAAAPSQLDPRAVEKLRAQVTTQLYD